MVDTARAAVSAHELLEAAQVRRAAPHHTVRYTGRAKAALRGH